MDTHLDSVVGGVRFYFVAGAERTGALSIALDADPTEDSLREAIEVLEKAQARLIVAEFPVVPGTGPLEQRLRARGFTDQAEIPDYYADGTAMRILAMRLEKESR